jgi:hypothetical protein
MQTKQTTGLRCTASDYVTIVTQASAKISGFDQLYKEMKRPISITGIQPLFKTRWSVLNGFGHGPTWLGAQTGMICTLHTWG